MSSTETTELPNAISERLSLPDESSNGVYAALGCLPPATLITEDGLARLLGKACRESIKRAVDRDELPPPIKLMGKNTWTVRAIIQYIEDRLAAESRRNVRRRA